MPVIKSVLYYRRVWTICSSQRSHTPNEEKSPLKKIKVYILKKKKKKFKYDSIVEVEMPQD